MVGAVGRAVMVPFSSAVALLPFLLIETVIVKEPSTPGVAAVKAGKFKMLAPMPAS